MSIDEIATEIVVAVCLEPFSNINRMQLEITRGESERTIRGEAAITCRILWLFDRAGHTFSLLVALDSCERFIWLG